jgi:ubiquinone biosynthesis protein Coq4
LIDEGSLEPVIAHYKKDHDTNEALSDVPALGDLQIENLASLPVGTLGNAFASYLNENKFGPEDIIYKGNRGSLDRHVAGHLYETHDNLARDYRIWHRRGGGARVTGFLLSASSDSASDNNSGTRPSQYFLLCA